MCGRRLEAICSKGLKVWHEVWQEENRCDRCGRQHAPLARFKGVQRMQATTENYRNTKKER